MIYSDRLRHDRKDIQEMPLMEWARDYCASGDKIQVILSASGKVTIKCLVNITSGDTYVLGEI